MVLQHICTVLQEDDFKFLRFIVKVGHLLTEPWNHCDRKLFIRETEHGSVQDTWQRTGIWTPWP